MAEHNHGVDITPNEQENNRTDNNERYNTETGKDNNNKSGIDYRVSVNASLAVDESEL